MLPYRFISYSGVALERSRSCFRENFPYCSAECRIAIDRGANRPFVVFLCHQLATDVFCVGFAGRKIYAYYSNIGQQWDIFVQLSKFLNVYEFLNYLSMSVTGDDIEYLHMHALSTLVTNVTMS